MPRSKAGRQFFAYRGLTLKFYGNLVRTFSYSYGVKRMTRRPVNGATNPTSPRSPRKGVIPKKNQGPPPRRQARRPRVLLIHASPVTRLGLTILLGRSGRFSICGETDSAATARALFERHRPELVVTGLTLRGGDGIGLIKDFRKSHPASRTLVISKREDALAVQRAFRAGARAYLMGGDDTDEILRALDRILLGELYASESVGRRLLENFAGSLKKPRDSKIGSLSDRELQVFSLFGRGFGATRLATELHLSVKTIETHQMRIKEKLGLRSAAELSKKASLWMSEMARSQLTPSR